MIKIIIETLLRENKKLEKENIALKKQMNDMKVQGIAKEVAGHIDNWLDEPYQEKKSEIQDINDFALKITKYVDHRMRD
jgi:hypothetical protein